MRQAEHELCCTNSPRQPPSCVCNHTQNHCPIFVVTHRITAAQTDTPTLSSRLALRVPWHRGYRSTANVRRTVPERCLDSGPGAAPKNDRLSGSLGALPTFTGCQNFTGATVRTCRGCWPHDGHEQPPLDMNSSRGTFPARGHASAGSRAVPARICRGGAWVEAREELLVSQTATVSQTARASKREGSSS